MPGDRSDSMHAAVISVPLSKPAIESGEQTMSRIAGKVILNSACVNIQKMMRAQEREGRGRGERGEERRGGERGERGGYRSTYVAPRPRLKRTKCSLSISEN